MHLLGQAIEGSSNIESNNLQKKFIQDLTIVITRILQKNELDEIVNS